MKSKIITTLLLILLVNTMYANVIILNGLTHVYSGSSGNVISGEIILVNGSEEDQRVTFQLNDAIFSCTNNKYFTDEITHNQSSIEWFNGNLSDKILAPKETFKYRFSINIPKNDNLRGSFWSILKVNVDKPIMENTLRGSNVAIGSKVSYAVALLTHVNVFDEVNLDFNNVKLNQFTNSNKKELDINLINESSFVEAVKLTIEIFNKNGEKVYELFTKRNWVFPGLCKDFKIDVSELPEGDYECVLMAEARDEFVGTNLSLTIK